MDYKEYDFLFEREEKEEETPEEPYEAEEEGGGVPGMTREETADLIMDGIEESCIMATLSMGEGDEGVTLRSPEIAVENFWNEIFRVTIRHKKTDDIAYKLSRWAVMNAQSPGSADIVLRLYPASLSGGLGIAAANPVDWYYRCERAGDAADCLQLMFSGRLVIIGNIDDVFVG